VPPLLSRRRAAGREKHPRLAEAQNPSRRRKSAFCVCRALQTLGCSCRALSFVGGNCLGDQSRKTEPGRKRARSPRKGSATTALVRAAPPGRRPRAPRAGLRGESGPGPPCVAQFGVGRASDGHQGGRRGEAARFWGSHSAPQRGLPFVPEPAARRGSPCTPLRFGVPASWRVLGAAPRDTQRFWVPTACPLGAEFPGRWQPVSLPGTRPGSAEAWVVSPGWGASVCGEHPQGGR